MKRLLLLALLPLVTAGCASLPDRIADAAQRGTERAVDREVSRQADQAATSVLRGAEDAVVCAVTDEACIENARRSGQAVEVRGTDGSIVEQIPAPGTDVDANYDFVPGNRVLFYEDYANDRVGNFPARFEFVSGNWEVAEWQGRRLLRNTGPRHSAFRIVLPEALPERFTIETEVYFPHGNQQLALMTQPPEGSWNAVDYNYFRIGGNHGTGVDAPPNSGLSTSINRAERVHEGLVPIRIIVDGEYAKVYVGENRTANIPNAVLPRSEVLHFENTYFADEENPMYIGPIRVAASGTSLYDALAAEGRVATQGIHFDTGSAQIRPESTPTLEEITQMLQQHDGLRLRIEGHTDDTGSASTNQTLSEQRAQAVRGHLVQQGIASSRLEAVGMGQTQPIADNGTAEGRQQNRRVELVRL